MRLHHTRIGEGVLPDLLILHGLLGSSRNWLATARDLSRRLTIHLLDLRNHGLSPRHPDVSAPALAGDVVEWIHAAGLAPMRVLGHSLGGKVAMRIACSHPELVAHLTVVDIAPRDYSPVSAELEALRRVDLRRVSTRADAEAQLATSVPDARFRAFLVTNLHRLQDGSWAWRVDVEALARGLPDMRRSPLVAGERFDGPTHFVLGATSSFVTPADHETIAEHFPRTRVETLEDCGHNPHVDARPALVAALFAELSRTR